MIACFMLPQLAFAGAWTLPQYDFWHEWYFKWHWAKNEYGYDYAAGRKSGIDKNARTWGWGMIPKLEFGLTDWMTLMTSIEYKEADYKEYAANRNWTVKNHAVTEVTVGTRVRVLKDPIVLSLQPKFFIYTGYVEETLSGRAESPGLSDRNDAFELRVLAGKIFEEQYPFYYGLETGYRWKNRDVANDIPFFAEFGVWPLDWLMIKTEIDGYWSHTGTGYYKKSYAIWRIGPVVELLDLYEKWRGQFIAEEKQVSYITKEQHSLNLECQFGQTFWGMGDPYPMSADWEIVTKISAQF